MPGDVWRGRERAFALPNAVDASDLHRLAGLLEGEGSFMPGPPSKPRTAVISLAMVDRDVMERARRLSGRKVQTIRPRRTHWSVSTSCGSPASARSPG